MNLNFQLVTLGGIVFEQDVYEVVLPTKDGIIAVLARHMPLMTTGAPGIISVRRQPGDSDMEHFSTMGGLIETDGRQLRFLADEVSSAADSNISEEEASAAVAEARRLISSAHDQMSLDQARQLLAHGQVRLQLARLKKRRR